MAVTVAPEVTFYGAMMIVAFMGMVGIIIGRARGSIILEIGYYLLFFTIGAISFSIIRDIVKSTLIIILKGIGVS